MVVARLARGALECEDDVIRRDERALFIGGWNLLHGLNHRARHVANHLETRFKSFDLVAFESFYSGSGSQTAPFWHKARQGIANLRSRRVRITTRHSVREIVIRDIYTPSLLRLLIKDVWRYLILRQVLQPPYDIAIVGDSENALLAWLLKQSGQVKRLIYDDWDYFPGLEHNWLDAQLMKIRERICIRQADAMITVGHLLAELRTRQGAKQIIVIPNGVDLPLFARARSKVPHPPTLIYLGALSSWYSVDLAIRAMLALTQSVPHLRLLIAGTGPAEAELKALSQSLNMHEKVSFLGPLEYQALPTVLAEADIGIATSSPQSEFRKYASPLKVIEYMGAGLPVIATRVGEMELIMRQANAGILINDSVEEFAAAVLDLLTDRAKYEQCARSAISYAAQFDWCILMDQACQFLVRILSGDSDPVPTLRCAQLSGDS